MYYSININQVAIINHNKQFSTNLDFADGCIMEYLQKQSTSHFAKKHFIIKDNEIYFLLCYDNIISQLPLLNIENKTVIGRRIKKLKEANIIKFFIDRKNNNKVYFNTTDLFETFFSYDLLTQKSRPLDLEVKSLLTQKSNHIYDKNISDNNIKDNKEKNIKKENSFEDSFIEFYKIYEQPKKEIGLTSQRIQKVYKKWKSCKNPEQIIEGAKNYIEYLQIAKWRAKKDILAWLNANQYEVDWQNEIIQENAKKTQITTYQKPFETENKRRYRETMEAISEMERKNDKTNTCKDINDFKDVTDDDDDDITQIDKNDIPF